MLAPNTSTSREPRIRFPDKKILLKVLANLFAMITFIKSSRTTIPEVVIKVTTVLKHYLCHKTFFINH